jgi:hypothetical protein
MPIRASTMKISIRRITISAVASALPAFVGCSRDTGLPDCAFADKTDWNRLPEQPPEAAAMLRSVENRSIDPEELLASKDDFHWFESSDGQTALCYYSDPFCAPRQLTFQLEGGRWTAIQVDFQLCM